MPRYDESILEVITYIESNENTNYNKANSKEN